MSRFFKILCETNENDAGVRFNIYGDATLHDRTLYKM